MNQRWLSRAELALGSGGRKAPPTSKVFAWARRGFWAVTDQALFAGTNFLVNLLMARWLEPAAYGAFSVAYSVFLFLGTLHTALWTEPMVVYGSGRFRSNFGAYHRILSASHWRFGILTSPVLLAVALVSLSVGRQELALSFVGLMLSAPAVLYLWLVRRGAYVLLEPQLASMAGALYLFFYLGIVLILIRLSFLNEATGLLAMACAGLFAAETIRTRFKGEEGVALDPREVRTLHWRYGRWALLAGALSWVPGNLYYLVLPAFHGLEAAAQFKAVTNLLMPVLHFNGALGQLLVPGMVRAQRSGGLGRFSRGSLVVFFFFALMYWMVLVGFGQELMAWLYGGRYVEASVWLSWLGLVPLLSAVASVRGALLRAQERPKAVAVAYGIVAVIASTVGVLLVQIQGLGGAVEAMLVVNAFTAIAFWWLSRGRVRG